jgi:hypothetical protein
MTARHHSRHLEELLPAYALGALDGDELRELAEHLAPAQGAPGAETADAAHAARPAAVAAAEVACPICAAELRRLADDLEAIAMVGQPVEGEAETEMEIASAAAAGRIEPPAPSAELRRRLLAQVAAEPRGSLSASGSLGASGSPPPAAPPAPFIASAAPSGPLPAAASTPIATPTARPSPVVDLAQRRRGPAAAMRGRWPRLAAAAALLLALGWGATRQAGLETEIRRLRGERDRLAARADSLERQAQAAQAQSERLARTLSILAAPGIESVRLAAMGSSHAAGRTYVDPAGRTAVFYASGLPALTAGQTYQLWYIDDEDRKTSAGVFQPDPQGKAALMVEQPLPVERIQSWVVTVEPSGGRPQPTGPIALAG